MVQRWSDNTIICFINLIKKYPCLWNKSDENYKNKIEQAIVWNKIEIEMGQHHFNKLKAEKKIQVLKSNYHYIIRKMKEAKNNGKEISSVPRRIWFDHMIDLMDAKPPDYSIDTWDNIEARSETSKSVDEKCEDLVERIITPGEDEYILEYSLEDACIEKDTLEGNISSDIENDIQNRVSSNCVKEEEFVGDDSDELLEFAQNLASQLQKLPLPVALRLQVRFQSMVTDERIRIHNKNHK